MKSKSSRKISILMYHAIGDSHGHEPGAYMYTVSKQNFRQQMRHISRQLYPTHKIYITFDDGDISNYECALPVLKEAGLQAYFFVLVSKIGTSGYMNWDNLAELRKEGMIIGSHGMTHRILVELSTKDLEQELLESKRVLEKKLNCRIDYFSVPRGFCNDAVIRAAKKAGYRSIFTSQGEPSDGFAFSRIAVRGDWDLKYFIQVLENGLSLKDRTKESVKLASKRILGAKHYDAIRSLLLNK